MTKEILSIAKYEKQSIGVNFNHLLCSVSEWGGRGKKEMTGIVGEGGSRCGGGWKGESQAKRCCSVPFLIISFECWTL